MQMNFAIDDGRTFDSIKIRLKPVDGRAVFSVTLFFCSSDYPVQVEVIFESTQTDERADERYKKRGGQIVDLV